MKREKRASMGWADVDHDFKHDNVRERHSSEAQAVAGEQKHSEGPDSESSLKKEPAASIATNDGVMLEEDAEVKEDEAHEGMTEEEKSRQVIYELLDEGDAVIDELRAASQKTSRCQT